MIHYILHYIQLFCFKCCSIVEWKNIMCLCTFLEINTQNLYILVKKGIHCFISSSFFRLNLFSLFLIRTHKTLTTFYIIIFDNLWIYAFVFCAITIYFSPSDFQLELFASITWRCYEKRLGGRNYGIKGKKRISLTWFTAFDFKFGKFQIQNMMIFYFLRKWPLIIKQIFNWLKMFYNIWKENGFLLSDVSNITNGKVLLNINF